MNKVSEEVLWIWLGELGSGYKTVYQDLIKAFGTAEKVWEAETPELMPDTVATKKKLAEKIADPYLREKAYDIEHKAKLNEGKITYFTKADYPKNLKEIYMPPAVLYYYGTLPEIKNPSMPLISVVGARGCSQYGSRCAFKLSAELAYLGVGIVSGMARGSDSRAHEGALTAGGYTLAVLGGGADVIYPYENLHLYYKIKEFGCVMSEYPPGTTPNKYYFPMRNRIIAGLSDGLIVCEAAASSGTMITVERAIEENRTIFALPGNIDSALSEGTNNLLKRCAVCCTDYKDVIRELGYKTDKVPPKKLLECITGLEGTNLAVAKAIEKGNNTPDKIQQATGLKFSEILNAITILEIKGVITRRKSGGFEVG